MKFQAAMRDYSDERDACSRLASLTRFPRPALVWPAVPRLMLIVGSNFVGRQSIKFKSFTSTNTEIMKCIFNHWNDSSQPGS